MYKIRGAGRTGLPARMSWSYKECFAGCVNSKHRTHIHLQCFGEYFNAVIKLCRAIIIMSELIPCWNSYLKFRSAVASKYLLYWSIQRNFFLIKHLLYIDETLCLVSWFNIQNSMIKLTFEFFFNVLTQIFRYIFNEKFFTTDLHHLLLVYKVY